jgi:hypothetical protein
VELALGLTGLAVAATLLALWVGRSTVRVRRARRELGQHSRTVFFNYFGDHPCLKGFGTVCLTEIREKGLLLNQGGFGLLALPFDHIFRASIERHEVNPASRPEWGSSPGFVNLTRIHPHLRLEIDDGSGQPKVIRLLFFPEDVEAAELILERWRQHDPHRHQRGDPVP